MHLGRPSRRPGAPAVGGMRSEGVICIWGGRSHGIHKVPILRPHVSFSEISERCPPMCGHVATDIQRNLPRHEYTCPAIYYNKRTGAAAKQRLLLISFWNRFPKKAHSPAVQRTRYWLVYRRWGAAIDHLAITINSIVGIAIQ